MAGEIENEILDMSLLNFADISDTDKTVVHLEDTSEIQSVNTTNNVQDIKETVEETVEKVPEENGKDTSSPANSDNVFKPFSEFLKEQGILSTDAVINSEEEFVEAFKAEIKRNEFAKLNDAQKEYLTSLESGIPEDIIKEHIKVNTVLSNITEDDLEQEELRKTLIIRDYVTSGIDAVRAEKQYKRMLDLGETYEEARLALGNLKQKDAEAFEEIKKQTEQQKIQKEQQSEKQLADLKKAVFETDKLFNTFKADVGLKTKIYESMVTPVDYTQEGYPINALMKHRMEDPVGFEASLYSLYVLTNGFKNIDRFITKSNTVAAKNLREHLTNSTLLKSGGDHNYNNDPEEYSSPIVNIEL